MAGLISLHFGLHDGAEVCELVGLYILHKLTSTYTNGSIGLYRDDGLAVFTNMSARSLDKARKDFSKIIFLFSCFHGVFIISSYSKLERFF